MFVTQLQIRAFRGIESLDLRFQPGVNVIIGINGAGKSSILDGLATSLFTLDPKISRHFPNAQSVKTNHTQSSCEIQLSTDHHGDGSLFWTIEHNSSTARSNLVDVFVKTDFPNVEISKLNHSYAYYPTRRYFPQELLFAESANEELDVRHLQMSQQAVYEHQIDFSNFFTWFKEREDLENEKRLEDNPSYRDRQLEAVRNAIPQFLPGFSHLRVRRTNLSITVSKNDQELSINQLSDGEKSLLTMVADIARRLAIHHPGLENPLQGTGVILIDEIDAHLHPQWQRRIVSTLQTTFPNCQFILATHSPFIISDLPPESIHLLSQTADGNVIAQHPNVSLGRDINQILELVMGVPERPDWSGDGLRRLFRLIEDGDLEGARQVKIELEQQMGTNEPDVMKAGAMIRRRELLGK
jgi:predicted ATP-binding protein involved in virulence